MDLDARPLPLCSVLPRTSIATVDTALGSLDQDTLLLELSLVEVPRMEQHQTFQRDRVNLYARSCERQPGITNNPGETTTMAPGHRPYRRRLRRRGYRPRARLLLPAE